MKFEAVVPNLREGQIIYLKDGGDFTFYYLWGGKLYSYYIYDDRIKGEQKLQLAYQPVDFDGLMILEGQWGVVEQEVENQHLKLGLRR